MPAQERGRDVGKAKRGKMTKNMAIADRHVFLSPLAQQASPHEVKLVDQTLDASHIPVAPDNLFGDKA